MLLHPGERVSHQGLLRRDEDGRTASIILTNLRLVIEIHGRGGLFSIESAQTAIDVPWHHVHNAVAIRKLLGQPILQIDTARSRSLWKTDQPDEWVRAIAHMKSALGYTPPPPPGSATSPAFVVNLPPPPPTRTIERQVVKVRCRHCGNLANEVPGRCERCGAPL
ncbi:MAG: hypothetical protein ACREC5_08280 [Thermoplasmata archaeon]